MWGLGVGECGRGRFLVKNEVCKQRHLVLDFEKWHRNRGMKQTPLSTRWLSPQCDQSIVSLNALVNHSSFVLSFVHIADRRFQHVHDSVERSSP